MVFFYAKEVIILFPKIPITKTNTKRSIIQFKGLNRNAFVADGQLTSALNMSTDKLPVLSVRKPRNLIQTLTTGNAMFTANSLLCWVDGTSFYYNGVLKGTVTSSSKSMVDFNGKVLIFPDAKYYDYVNDVFGTINNSYTSGAGQISFKNKSLNIADGSKVTFTHNTITISDGSNWPSEFVAGAVIEITGCVQFQGNNKFVKITAVNSTTQLQFANNTFTAGSELASSVVTFAHCGIVTTGLDFTGFSEGDYIQVTGCTAKVENNTYAEIRGVAAKILSFDPSKFVAASESGAITVKIPFPTNGIDYATVWNNRVWGVKKSEIFCTKLGAYNNWMQYSGPEGVDNAIYAWAADTGSAGDFTGICTYGNHVICVKEDLIFEIYGTEPSNFRYVEVSKIGCISNKSIVEINGILYFLGRHGVYIYSGGIPRLISQDLNETYTNGIAGSDGRKYFLSLYNGTGWKLYVYDTQNNEWMQEDTTQAKDYIVLDGELYALHSDHKIYKYKSGTESISWEAVFDIDSGYTSDKKYIKELFFRVEIESGGSLSVYDKVDNGSFTLQKTYSDSGLTSFFVALIPKRCDHYQIKLAGTKNCDIYMLEKVVMLGSGR